MESEAARQRLATMVSDRRKKLILSRRGAAKLAEIHTHTWTAVEQGTRSPQDSTREKMECLLGWASGSITAILDGGEPTLAEPSTTIDSATLAVFARQVLLKVQSIIDLEAPPVPQVDQIHVVVSTYKNSEAELRRHAQAATTGSGRDQVAAR